MPDTNKAVDDTSTVVQFFLTKAVAAKDATEALQWLEAGRRVLDLAELSRKVFQGFITPRKGADISPALFGTLTEEERALLNCLTADAAELKRLTDKLFGRLKGEDSDE